MKQVKILITNVTPGYLLEKIHAEDPYLKAEEAEKAGLGESKYEIAEVN